MLKSVLICSLFLVCMQNETTSRRKRQSTPNSSVINLPGNIKIIRRTNVLSHDLCAKLCGEEKLIKCKYFKYVGDQKLCYHSEQDQPNIAVSGSQPNSTVDHINAVFSEKEQLPEFAEFLSHIKDADQRQRPKTFQPNPVAKETMGKVHNKARAHVYVKAIEEERQKHELQGITELLSKMKDGSQKQRPLTTKMPMNMTNIGRHKRQSTSNSSVVNLPGNIRIIRRTNVSSHDLCAKFCDEEKLIKCQYFKYVDDQKLCYLSERDQPNIAVSGLPPNTTADHKNSVFSEEKHQKRKLQEIAELLSQMKDADRKQRPKVLKLNSKATKTVDKGHNKASTHMHAKSSEEEQKKRKLQEIAELLSKMKDASQKQRPGVVNLNPMKTKMPTYRTNIVHKKANQTVVRLKNVEKDVANIQGLRDKILQICKTIVGNFTKIKEMQIKSLLHFNKRIHNLNKYLLKATKDIRSIKASMNELQNKTSDTEVQEDIASLKKSRQTFDATLRKLEGRSANLHNDISVFHQLMIVIAKKIDALNKQSRNDAKMQKFQAVAVKSMEELHQHGKKIRKQIRRLEHNIKLVAHGVVLSQFSETKSKSMIENINDELRDLKKAVQTSYVWQNVENLGGFRRREQSRDASREISGLLQKLKTFVRRLNEANNDKFKIMNRRMNKFLQRTVELVAKMERRNNGLVRQRVEKLQQVLVESLKSFSRWTLKEKKKVKSLDKEISDLTLKTSRLSDGSQNFEKDSYELKKKLDRIRKKEKSLVLLLKNAEKSNLENSAKLRGDLRNAIKKAMDKKSKLLTKQTEKKIQTAMTAAKKVNRKLEKMKQKEDKKLKETKAKLDAKVNGVMKKVSEKVSLDELSTDTNIKLQSQKKQIQRALAKLKDIGKSQYLKLNEKVEAIMNEKTGSVNDKVDSKLAKIKDAVRHTIVSISTAEDTDHKRIAAIQKKIGRFLNEVKDIEKKRQKETKTITRAEEEKRTEKVNKLLAATAKKVTEMQHKIAKKNRQKVRKLKKEMKKITDKVMENVSEQNRKGKEANKILKEKRIKLGRKVEDLEREMKYKKKFAKQWEQNTLKEGRRRKEKVKLPSKANKISKERLKLGRKIEDLEREMKYKKKFAKQGEQKMVKKGGRKTKKVKLPSKAQESKDGTRKPIAVVPEGKEKISGGKEEVIWKKKKHPKMKVIPDDGKHRKLPKGAIKIPIQKKGGRKKEKVKLPSKADKILKERLKLGRKIEDLEREMKYKKKFAKQWEQDTLKGKEEVTRKTKKRPKMRVIPDDGKHRELPEGAVKVPFQKKGGRKKEKVRQPSKANKILKEKRLKLGRKVEDLEREMKYKKKFAKQWEQNTSKKGGRKKEKVRQPSKANKILKERLKLGRKIEDLEREMKYKKKFAKQWEQNTLKRVIPDDGKHRELPEGAVKVPFRKKGGRKKEVRLPSKANKILKEKKLKLGRKIEDLEREMKYKKKFAKQWEQNTLKKRKKEEVKQPNKANKKLKERLKLGRKIEDLEREMKYKNKYAKQWEQKTLKQKIATKKKLPIKIFQAKDKIRNLPVGAVKVAFLKRKTKLGEKLLKVTQEYKIAKRKELKMKKKLEMNIKEEKKLPSSQLKSYKEKKFVEKRKKQLKKKIKDDRKLYKQTVKKVRRMREMKKNLEEKLLETHKPKKRKEKTIKIIPDDGGKRFPKESTKVTFQKKGGRKKEKVRLPSKANKILKEKRLKLGRTVEDLEREMKYKNKFAKKQWEQNTLKHKTKQG